MKSVPNHLLAPHNYLSFIILTLCLVLKLDKNVQKNSKSNIYGGFKINTYDLKYVGRY